jgi:hypothetical protein
MDFRWIVLVILLILLAWNVYGLLRYHKEGYTNNSTREEYIQRFLKKDHRMFPFRYFTDENNKPLPFVAVTAFFRGKDAEDRYNEYVKNGIHIFGITAYKSFPNRELLDKSEGQYERTDTFDFTNKIRDWLCCFKNKENYGFTSWNRTIDISESDFYNAEKASSPVKKTYDFIYICNKDTDSCPMDGWNAINRNFDLAKKCFPIMCTEFGLKGLIVGREGCGLEKEYGDKLEVIGWLEWHVLQEKMRASKFLFVPNVFDASPRVVAECLTKDLAVLMNRKILCGSKYITYETGELFTDETDIRPALTTLLNKQYKISPKKWWSENYSQEKSQKALREFLDRSFPNELKGIERVQFIL